MNAIKGIITVRETGRGVANLLVVIYDLDPECRPVKRDHFPMHVKGERLGSVLTDARGQFTFQYSDEAFQGRAPEGRPDLALFVLAPEDPFDTVCPRVLHVACDVRLNAGRLESYVIRLPEQLLLDAGVIERPTRPTASDASELHRLVTQIRARGDKQIGRDAKRSFSERYLRAQQQFLRAYERSTPEVRAPDSFDAELEVRYSQTDQVAEGTELMWDEQDGFLLKEGPESQPVRLTFGGLMDDAQLAAAGVRFEGAGLFVDRKRHTIHYHRPHSPERLVLTQAGPGPLYLWYARRHRKAGPGDGD